MKAKKILTVLLAALIGTSAVSLPAAADISEPIAVKAEEEQYETPRLPDGYSFEEDLENLRAKSPYEDDFLFNANENASKYLYYINRRAGSDANIKAMDDAANAIVAKIDPNWSDLTKIIYVNDYFASTKQYDLTYSKYGAYNLLVENTAVCQGYAEGFWYIMYKLGIDCKLVTSQSLDHAWNLVKIDNMWYHVDVTWNDPVPDKEGRARHEYFLLNDTEMKNRKHDATDWKLAYESNASAYNYATSAKYNSYFWKNVNVPIIIKNGSYYYLDPSEAMIMKADANDNKTSVRSVDTGSKWYVWGKTNSYWTGNYSGLQCYGNYFIYNDPTNIYCCNIDGSNPTVIYTLNSAEKQEGYIYSLILNGDVLKYILGTHPTQGDRVTHTLNIKSLFVPANPTVKATAGNGEVTLTWNTVDKATRYKVYYRVSGSASWSTAGIVTASNCTVKNLTNGKKYEFAVCSGDSSSINSIDSSKIVTATPSAPASLKPEITSAKVVNGNIVLEWKAVDNASVYRVVSVLNGKNTIIGDTSKTSYTLTNVEEGQKYGFFILAYANGKWTSYTSNDIVYVNVPVTNTKPDITSATVLNNNEVSLTWKAVSNASIYRVILVENGQKTVLGDTANTNCTVTDLEEGCKYGFYILVYANGKWDGYTTNYTYVTMPTTNTMPDITSATVIDDGEVELVWKPVSNASIYRIVMVENGQKSILGDVKDTSCTVTDLEEGHTYGFYILVYANGKWGGYTTNYTYVTMPTTNTMPDITSATVTGNGVVELVWKPVSNASIYRVVLIENGQKTILGDTKNTSCTVTDLEEGQKYGFYVLVYANGKWGGYTTNYTYVTMPTTNTKPDITSAVSGTNQVALTWKAVNNASVYRIVSVLNGRKTIVADTTDTSYTVTGLESGQQYGFYILVYANGAWSGYTDNYYWTYTDDEITEFDQQKVISDIVDNTEEENSEGNSGNSENEESEDSELAA